MFAVLQINVDLDDLQNALSCLEWYQNSVSPSITDSVHFRNHLEVMQIESLSKAGC